MIQTLGGATMLLMSASLTSAGGGRPSGPFRAVPGCSGPFQAVPGCSEPFQAVPGRSGPFPVPLTVVL